MKCPRCEIHIDEHEANRCLDAWVAEKVMGFEVALYSNATLGGYLHIPWIDQDGCWIVKNIPEYSAQIADAWEIIEKLRQKHILLPLWSLAVLEYFPLAICRSAIKATL